MSPAVRFGAYALILAAVFVVAYLLGGALVPEGLVDAWMDSAASNTHAH